MIRNRTITFLVLLAALLTGCSEKEDDPPPPDPVITWARTYGGTGLDVVHYVRQTSDGGYLAAGYTDSFGAGQTDVLVVKVDEMGDVAWAKTFGGSGEEKCRAVGITADGGCVVGGTTDSWGAGGTDFWLFRLDSSGAVVWQEVLGGSFADLLSSLCVTPSGEIGVTGYTRSFGGTDMDFWVLRLNHAGTVLSQKVYGGSADDVPKFITNAAGGGFIVAGQTESAGQGATDMWVLELASDLTVNWQKCYGQSLLDIPLCIQPAGSSGYVLTGHTSSTVAVDNATLIYDDHDALLMRLDSTGSIVWQKTYGGTDYDKAYFVSPALDGGFLFGGKCTSYAAGSIDLWVLKADSAGDLLWQRCFGGLQLEYLLGLEPASGGGLIAGGYTHSYGAGNQDLWLLKLDADGLCGSLATPSTAAALNSSLVSADPAASVSVADTAATVAATSAATADVTLAIAEQHP